MHHRILFFLLLAFASFSHAAEAPLEVLMIGNSYTGGIRRTMEAIKGAGPRSIAFTYHTPGGRQLVQHDKNDKVTELIKSKKWDVVVLQEQSQTPAYANLRPTFQAGVKALHKKAVAQGARVLLYQTWGRRDGDKQNIDAAPTYEVMQKALTQAYTDAAKDLNCELAEVGVNWQRIRENHPDLFPKLYRNDGSHPSELGAYLAGSVIYRQITGKLPDPAVLPNQVDKDAAKVIQRVLGQ